MSGLELITVLGVAASAIQLMDYSSKAIEAISDIYTRVKDAPSRIVQYTTQIHQIIDIGREIQENTKFQSALVESQVQHTLAEIKHLLQILTVIRHDYTTGPSRKRIWKAIVGQKERHLLKSFERLEKEKIALILCITVVHTQKLETIGNGVEVLVEREMGIGSDIREKLKAKKEKQTKQKTVNPESEVTKAQNITAPRPNSGAPRDPPKLAAASTGTSSSKKGKTKPEGRVYTSPQSSKKASQINGDYNTGRKISHSYNTPVSQGDSLQINGNYASSGDHQYNAPHATDNSLQINGDAGFDSTPARIRQDYAPVYPDEDDDEEDEGEDSEEDEEEENDEDDDFKSAHG